MSNEQIRGMAKLAKMIEGNDQVRAKKCSQEIDTILKKYDCVLVPRLMLTPGNVLGSIDVVARPRESKDDRPS